MAKRTFQDVPLGHEISVYFGEDKGPGSVMVTQGSATSFGAPLVSNHTYTLENQGIPIATTTGCRLEIVNPSKLGQAGPIDSAPYDLHALLQKDRLTAAASATSSSSSQLRGPRVLIVGNVDTGKSSLCRYLINLGLAENVATTSSSSVNGASTTTNGEVPAIGQKRTVSTSEAEVPLQGEEKKVQQQQYGITYIDGDLGQTAISLPGTVASVFLSSPVGPLQSFAEGVMPLVWNFGDAALRNGPSVGRYLDLMAVCKQSIDSLETVKSDFRAGGVVVNTMGWTTGLGFGAIKGIMDTLAITHVVVTGGDTDLYDRVKQVASENPSLSNISVLHYRSNRGKSTFVRSKNVRALARRKMITDYFVGTPQKPLYAPRLVLKLEDCTFLDSISFMAFDYPPMLAVCAVSTARDYDELPYANVAGFVVVTDVGDETVSLLSPSLGEIPNKMFLVNQFIKMAEEDVPPISKLEDKQPQQ